ncbi:MAG: hypothetical protein NC344_06910 [Bacteroidales bacterium]|nr:hypothetical protein [Bacteroidales bacterium]MCM1147547.1 hypothetical protein [Bacteroidales bacterium]MCM1206337.1 hypothetical protein [Bacillota bacterium]MCM1511234.1 hypothetical protein [Clostridium sp.]
MIQQNINYSVLPWYTSIEQQNHRKSYAYGQIYPLYTPANTLLPFQIMRRHRAGAEIQSVLLYRKNGVLVRDITQEMKDTGLRIISFPLRNLDVVIYPNTMPMSLQQADGQYYAVMSDGVETWYSEVFTVVQDMSGYLRIEWYDKENLEFDDGIIVYRNPLFKNYLYLCSEVGKPEYTFEEDGETRDGYFFTEKQLSEKTYRFTFLAPEYLCDVMRLIRMSDYVNIRDKYGREYNCDTFLITPKWETQGNLASIEAEFDTATVVKKIGRGYILRDTGDYDDDYNNDYNKEGI